MRKEDEQAIKRAISILKVECQQHKSCNSCKFYVHSICILDRPPMHYSIDDILKCFTLRYIEDNKEGTGHVGGKLASISDNRRKELDDTYF